MRESETSVGKRIAERRRARGMTQNSLSTAASMDRTALAKIESGRRRVSSAELGRIARALSIPIEALLDEARGKAGITLGELRRKRKAILRVAARHGATSVRVFGSVARDEATPTSDVDLLVKLDPGRTLLDHAALLVELQRLLGKDVDVVTVEGLRERLRERITREAVPL